MVVAVKARDAVISLNLRAIFIRSLWLAAAITALTHVLLVNTVSAAATTAEKIDRAANHNKISESKRLLYGLRSYASPSDVPRSLRGEQNDPSRELTPLLRDALRASARLSPTQQQEVRRYTRRPTEPVNFDDDDGNCQSWVGQTVKTYDSYPAGRFKLHWIEATEDAPASADVSGPTGATGVPDYIEDVGAALEETYIKEVTDLGWDPPPVDDPGASQHDVYFCELLSTNSTFGYVAGEAIVSGDSASSYMVLDDDFVVASPPAGLAGPADLMKATVAHEFHHMIQYGYDYWQDTWMMESTATWMEDQVYDSVNDYVRYLPGWVSSYHRPLTEAANGRAYGSSAWNFWLAEAEGFGPDAIRRAWEDSSATNHFAPGAYSSAIVSKGGAGFADSFARFAMSLAEWRTDTRYTEGASYPDVPRNATLPIGGTLNPIVNHTAFSLIDIPVPASGAVRLRAWSQDGSQPSTAAVAALVGRDGANQAIASAGSIPASGPAVMTLTDANQYSRITAVLANRDVAHSGFNADPNVLDWIWVNDSVPFLLHADTGNVSPAVGIGASGKFETGSPMAFNATASDTNFGDSTSLAWDLDNDGQFDDASGATAAATYNNAGDYTVKVRATDSFSATGDFALSFSIKKSAASAEVPKTDQPPRVRANLSKLPRVKRARMRLRFSASENVNLTGVIKYGRREIAKARAKGTSKKKSVISFRLKKKYWKLLRKRKKLKISITLTARDTSNQKSIDKRKTLIRKG